MQTSQGSEEKRTRCLKVSDSDIMSMFLEYGANYAMAYCLYYRYSYDNHKQLRAKLKDQGYKFTRKQFGLLMLTYQKTLRKGCYLCNFYIGDLPAPGGDLIDEHL